MPMRLDGGLAGGRFGSSDNLPASEGATGRFDARRHRPLLRGLP
jgi:hypothetical protein